MHVVTKQVHVIVSCSSSDRYNMFFIAVLHCKKITLMHFWVCWAVFKMQYSLPPHGLHTPARTKDVKWLWETVVVYQASVDGEQSHHQDDITPLKERVPDLLEHIKSLSYTSDTHTHTHTHSHRYFFGHIRELSHENSLTSFLVFLSLRLFSHSTIHAANRAMMTPWPRSPNITANRNGKVMIVKGATDEKCHTIEKIKFNKNIHIIRKTNVRKSINFPSSNLPSHWLSIKTFNVSHSDNSY